MVNGSRDTKRAGGAPAPLVGMLRRSTRVVAVQPWLVARFGPGPALWLSQVLWRMEVERAVELAVPDGAWAEETGLGRDQVRRARKKLEDAGWVACVVRKVDGVPTTHIRLVVEVVEEALTLDCAISPSRDSDCAISHSPGLCDFAQSSISQTVEDVATSPQPTHTRGAGRRAAIREARQALASGGSGGADSSGSTERLA